MKKFDEAFYLVKDRVDAEFSVKIRSAEQNPLLVTQTGMWPRVQSTYKEYLEKFSNELWEKIKKIIPDSPAINDFDWDTELKGYIIDLRIHDYYLNAVKRFKKFKVPETTEWYDGKYQSVIDDLDYEIGAAIGAIKNKYPINMRDKETSIMTIGTLNSYGPTQIGNYNTQHVFNAIQTIEQAIDKSDKTPEEKTKAKGMFRAALDCGGVIWEKTVAGITEAILSGSK